MTDNSNTSTETRRLDVRQRKFSKYKRKISKHIWLVRLGILVALIVGIVMLLAAFGSLVEGSVFGTMISFSKNFLLTPTEKIDSISERTNLLILGKAGGDNTAPDLTDTIIFVSINHKDPAVSLFSIPRDIWVPALRAKINSAYYWGNQKIKGGGVPLSSSSVVEVVGEPIMYGVVIDFSGFVKFIDALGGITVEVERSFVDERYPIAGKEAAGCDGDPEFACRYQTVEFVEGPQQMDGERALIFARSRNADSQEEGTDIARSARQQKIIEGIIAKSLSREILFSPKKIKELATLINDSVETDIGIDQAAIMARRLLQARANDRFTTHAIPEEYLENPPVNYLYDNQYVFVPSSGSWDEVHKWILGIID